MAFIGSNERSAHQVRSIVCEGCISGGGLEGSIGDIRPPCRVHHMAMAQMREFNHLI